MADPTARPGSPEHEDFEALAAGYALHALEPEDEQQLSAHLMTCPRCARLVADTAALGAAFADLLEPEAPPPGLRERILAAATVSPRGPVEPAATAERIELAVTPVDAPAGRPPRVITRRFRGRPEIRARLAIGALAAAIGVAVAVPVTLASTRHRVSSDSAIAQALLASHAQEVTLTAASGQGRATAVVSDKGVLLIADGMRANDRARNIYVLWAANAAGERRPVTSFDVHSGGAFQLAASKLPYSAAQIRGLAVSLEPGRTVPAKATDVVMTGTAA